MNKIHLFIDGKQIESFEDIPILWVALDNGIYIPNLCAIRERKEPYGGCRLCFVEVEGHEIPLTACTVKAKDGMRINTKGPTALRLARTAFELILSNHPVDCAHCLKTGLCELQKIAKHLGVKLKTQRLKKFLRDLPIDETSPVFIYDPNKCVLCGRCVWYCHEKTKIGEIGFAYRGFQRCITTFDNAPIGESECRNQRELIEICPVGAFGTKDRSLGKGKIYQIGG
ncbi:MAG: 2Fe-2S iron-sulfur cluster-binding protein [Thermodesulfobacteriota bacterium]